jgi:hypothetical protein
MTQNEFVVLYVGLPLAIAVGWLIWRGRYLLRNILLYAVAVAVLLAVIRLGHLAWVTWEAWAYPVVQPPTYPVCIDPATRAHPSPDGSCWT